MMLADSVAQTLYEKLHEEATIKANRAAVAAYPPAAFRTGQRWVAG
jgi:hypothetical protein